MEASMRIRYVTLFVTDLAAARKFHAPPEKQEWGGTLAHLKDSAGNVLTLVG
jgi:hypothetical protein